MRSIAILFLCVTIFSLPMGNAVAAEESSAPDYPKVMVVIDDFIDSVPQETHGVALKMEEIFAANGFPVVKREAVQKTDIDDVTLIYAHPGEIARVAKKYGAEVVIAGRATSDIVDTDLPYGKGVATYEARIQARVIKTSDARVIAMDKVLDTARAGEKNVAAEKALSGVAEKLSESLMVKISRAWEKRIYKTSTIRLACENADLIKTVTLKKALGTLRGITGVNEKSLVNGILELDVIYYGTTDSLVRVLRQQAEPLMEVSERGPNLIRIKFLKKEPMW
ncbi:hypothetical protein ACFL3J_00115 [Candidatus Omnitrophota bacterium]